MGIQYLYDVLSFVTHVKSHFKMLSSGLEVIFFDVFFHFMSSSAYVAKALTKILILTSECCLKYIKWVFEVTKTIQNGAKWPLTTNHRFVYNIYKTVCLKTEFLLISSTWLLVLVVMRGFSIGWVSHVIIISACNWSSQRNPEKVRKAYEIGYRYNSTCSSLLK